MATMKTCYHCDKGITDTEAVQAAERFENMTESMIEEVTDRLNLVHCQGPAEQFFPDDDQDRPGAVVVCLACLEHGEEE